MSTLSTAIKLLTFRLTRDEMLEFNKSHFIAGLIGTWIVGMGRYWDDSGAHLFDYYHLDRFKPTSGSLQCYGWDAKSNTA
jgi:hypothetical protein